MLCVFSVNVITQYPSGAVMNKRGNQLNKSILHSSHWNLKGIYATKGIRDFETLRVMFMKIQILWHVGPFQLVHIYRVYCLHLLDLLVYAASSYLKLSYTAFRVTSKVNKQTLHSRQTEQGLHKLNLPQEHNITRLNPINPWVSRLLWNGLEDCYFLGYDVV
jgi:hypothetical protein